MLGLKLCSVIMIIMGVMPKIQYSYGKSCSNIVSTVYATDGTTCHLFRNYCHFTKNNHILSRLYKPILSLVTKEKCQTQCPVNCAKEEKNPVCGEYLDYYTTFRNHCSLKSFSCLHGFPYILEATEDCSNLPPL